MSGRPGLTAGPVVMGVRTVTDCGFKRVRLDNDQENHIWWTTGADQAALDVAIELGIPYGGWVPKGRLTGKGPLPEWYHLKEMPSASYPQRTEKNVIESHRSLIITHGKPMGGSALTKNFAKKYNRPWFPADMNIFSFEDAAKFVKSWIEQHWIEVLHVAGPRASTDQSIYQTTKDLLMTVLR
jgi:hypothetical protein